MTHHPAEDVTRSSTASQVFWLCRQQARIACRLDLSHVHTEAPTYHRPLHSFPGNQCSYNPHETHPKEQMPWPSPTQSSHSNHM